MKKDRLQFVRAWWMVLIMLASCNPRPEGEGSVEEKQPPAAVEAVSVALAAATQFAETGGRTIAYRTFGQGPPLVLCNRFRGVLDSWDPLFLDSLAGHFQVITFDYSGVGRSTFKDSMGAFSEVEDVLDLVAYLNLDKINLLGWSHGGKVAQAVAAYHGDKISHLILVGTGPLGKSSNPPEQIFFDRALKPVNDFDDEVILFFEPTSKASVEAARPHSSTIQFPAPDASRATGQ